MSTSFIILLLIYLVVVTIHLYCCHANITNVRISTKVFLMPLLGILYYIGTEKDRFSKNILSAIIFGFFGDVFLLANPYSIWFLPAVICFVLGHILYVVSFLREAGMHNLKKYFYSFLIIAGIYFYGETIAFEYLKEGFAKRKMMIHGILYLSLLMILNITAGFYMFTCFNFYTFLTFIGANIFFFSDFILVRNMFYENKSYYEVTIMALYISAQSLICYGLAHKKGKSEYKKKIN